MVNKDSQEKKQSKVGGILAIIAIIILVIVGVVYFLMQSGLIGSGNKTTATDETATTTEKKPAADKTDETDAEDDTGPFKGWAKFSNKDWGISARYPIGWTISETAGFPTVTFIGPPTPTGGAILYECTFSIMVENISSAIGLEAYVTAARTTPQGMGDITKQIETTLDSNDAIQIVDTYAEAGQPWKRLRTWLIKNDKAYTFTFAASPNYNKVDYYSPHIEEAELILESVLIK